ncbi:MAG: DUF4184 family protein [Gammaproteobacteria bacterium]|nr:DUF4184 family protein [Gammaproteobacteria bacterium]
MPFTLAHPAAILPLRGWRQLRTVPLVIGALVPDLPYYLPASLARFVLDSHDFRASFTKCLLLGYALLAGVVLLRQPLTALLPARARALCLAAVAPFTGRAREWAWAAPAIVLGVWTHLLWDSFTHADGWMVQRIAALRAAFVLGPWHETVYHALQYLSSLVGLCVLVLWYDRLAAPAADQPYDAARSAAVPVLLLALTAAILIGGVQAVEQFGHHHSVYRTIEVLLTHALDWFGVLYLTAGTVLTLEHGAPGGTS